LSVVAGAVLVIFGLAEVAGHFVGGLFVKPMAKRMMMVSAEQKISILIGPIIPTFIFPFLNNPV
jgi:competence transcription factor ComK